ncbi:ArdC-like ssDNA-binding domain-containing protein [Nocardioides sp. NPDC057772]|uniref:ArdC-like ssDNA-binding domain-containing protein n=1 Tax=Nocardioides sp. NPDC057772 TaxID=3346245 RepID=UPI00366DC202
MSTTPTERQARKQAEREAKLEALQQRLTSAVEGLVTGEDWRRALEFSADFRSRSFRNTMLIAAQHSEAYEQGRVPRPVPTYVAGFKQWLGLGRTVVKGQAGYQILAPSTARFASATPSVEASWRRLATNEKPQAGETARTRMVGVRVAYVWDISQTEGAPIPTLPRPAPLAGSAPDGLWDGLADQITARGFELRLVSNAESLGGSDGLTDYLTRQVSIRTDMDDLNQVTALSHELAHCILHGPENPEASADAMAHRGVREAEAQGTSLMVLAAHGLDTTDFTVPYVSYWATTVPGVSPVDVVQATAERVRRTALGILDGLETAKVSDGAPPGLERPQSPPSNSADLTRPVTRVQPSEAIGL